MNMCPITALFSSFRFGCFVLTRGIFVPLASRLRASPRRKRARTRSTKKTGNARFVDRDRLKIGFTSVNSAKRRRPSSISRSTIPFHGDTSRRSRGNVRRNADMRRRLRDTERCGNAFVSRCSLLCVSIALIASSARLVSGQRWVRAQQSGEAMLVCSRWRSLFFSRRHE